VLLFLLKLSPKPEPGTGAIRGLAGRSPRKKSLKRFSGVGSPFEPKKHEESQYQPKPNKEWNVPHEKAKKSRGAKIEDGGFRMKRIRVLR
jgi:hypothetical protein